MRPPKHVLLLRPRATAGPELGRAVARATSAWRDARRDVVAEVVVHATEAAPPRLSLVPFRREGFAMVSARAVPDAIGALRAALAPLGRLEGYLVDETVPRARACLEPAGTIADGPALVTLFRQHPRLDRGSFLREWHGHHTPLALEVHPLAGYVRNVVEEVLDEGAPRWDGIVVETFAAAEDLRSPIRFFGGPRASALHAVRNALRVGMHASRFLDLRTIENHLVTERVLDRAP
jgi:hypothetical protein